MVQVNKYYVIGSSKLNSNITNSIYDHRTNTAPGNRRVYKMARLRRRRKYLQEISQKGLN